METKAKCPMCGEEFFVRDIKNPAKTCGRKTCEVNLKYQERHYNTRTGHTPDPKDINKL